MSLSTSKKSNNSAFPERRQSDEFLFVSDEKLVSDDDFIEEPQDNAESDPFLYSLENLVPDDIAPPPPKKSKTKIESFSNAARLFVLIVCAAIFAGSLLYIISKLYYYRLAREIYSDIKMELDIESEFTSVNSAVRQASPLQSSPVSADFVTSMSLTADDYAQINKGSEINKRVALSIAKLNSWKLQNKDVYGYIKIANTRVDDIIVQTSDNDYYLNHSWKGDYLPNGAIFADYRCNTNILKNYNTILYGHHMTDKTMFNTLDYLFQEDFFHSNRFIEIFTFDGIFTYEIFAVYITDMHYQYIRTAFNSGQDFIDFAYEMKSNSIFQRETMDFNENDRILTLSTCTNRVQTDRIAVQAKLVKIEK